jgi:hypothetical protein
VHSAWVTEVNPAGGIEAFRALARSPIVFIR